MNCIGDDFFTGACFTLDDDRCIGRGDFLEDAEYFPHLDMGPDDVAIPVIFAGINFDLFVDALELQSGVAQFERTASLQVGFLDANLVDESAVGAAEVPDDVVAPFLDDLAVISTDRVVSGHNEIIVIHGAQVDLGLLEDVLYSATLGFEGQATLPEMECGRTLGAVSDLRRGHIIWKLPSHGGSVPFKRAHVNWAAQVDVRISET